MLRSQVWVSTNWSSVALAVSSTSYFTPFLLLMEATESDWASHLRNLNWRARSTVLFCLRTSNLSFATCLQRLCKTLTRSYNSQCFCGGWSSSGTQGSRGTSNGYSQNRRSQYDSIVPNPHQSSNFDVCVEAVRALSKQYKHHKQRNKLSKSKTILRRLKSLSKVYRCLMQIWLPAGAIIWKRWRTMITSKIA